MNALEKPKMDSRKRGRKHVWLVFLCVLVTVVSLWVYRGTARSMELNRSEQSSALAVKQLLQASGGE